MKKILTFFIGFLFITRAYTQSILMTPNKVESKQSASVDNIVLQSTNQPNILGKRQNGTLAVPAAVATDDDLLSIQATGYNGSAFTNVRGALRFEASQNWTSSNNGTRIKFLTTPNGSTNLTERMVINPNGNIGIGLSSPSHKLELLQDTDSDNGIGINRIGGDAPTFFGISANGTANNPTSTLNGNILGRFGGKGFDGTSITNAKARIDMVANQNWTSVATGTDIKFYTTTGGTNSATEKVVFKGNGKVGIGTSDPTSTVTINGDLQLFSTESSFDAIGQTITRTALDRNNKSVIKLNGCGDVHLKGIAGGVDGLVLHIYTEMPCDPFFAGNKTVKIFNESADANPENRIITGESGVDPNISITNEGGLSLIYDGDSLRWRVIGVQR